MKHFFQDARRSVGVRQSALVIVGNTLGSGLSAVALIVISRLLGPAEFGEFTVGFALAMIITRINDAGLSSALLRFAASTTNHQVANIFFSLSLRYRVLLSLPILVIGFILSPWLIDTLHLQHPSIVILAVIFGVTTVYYEQLLSMLQSLHLFAESVAANIIQSGIKVLIAFGLWFFAVKSSLPVFFSYMLAPIVPVMLSMKLLPDWVQIHWTKPFPKEGQQLRTVTKHFMVSLVAAGIIENIDVLFVQKYLNSYETGLLGGVSRIALFFALVAYSLANVLNPRVARYKEKKHLKPYFQKAILLSVLAGLAFFAFVPFAKLSILLTIGPEYIQGLDILLILVGSSFLLLACIPFIALFYAYDAAWYFSISGFVQLAIVVVGNGYFVPRYGLAASAWTRLVSKLFLLTFTVMTAFLLYYRNYAAKEK